MATASRFLPVFVLAGACAIALAGPGCDGGGKVTDTSSSTSTAHASSSSSSKSSSSASTGSSSTSSDASTTDASSSASTGTGMGGMGGTGGVGPGWPTCDAPPTGAPTKTIPDVWSADPPMPTKVWLPGVYVTAVALGGCVAGQACTIFIQQDESYADFASAAKKSIPIGIAPSVSDHFVGIKPGDKVDAFGYVFRNTQDGANELGILVTPALKGCAKVVGSGAPTPVAATIDQLTTPYYEANGPALITLSNVSGKPHMAKETFGMWDTVAGPTGTIDTVTSMSPYCLPNEAFVGFTPEKIVDFSSVTGVFGILKFSGSPTKYEELYIRDMTEAVLK